MPEAVFVISNPGHHVDMTLPVAARLRQSGRVRPRVVSLCELRGFDTPRDRFARAEVEIEATVPLRIRKSPADNPVHKLQPSAQGVIRGLTWTALSLRLKQQLRGADVAVLPNDAAYPYDRIARMLRDAGRPFVLLQEGIRFPLPKDTAADAYGSGGATAIAAWGETSAAYFRAQGAAPSAIHLTGTPRLDGIRAIDRSSDIAELRRRLGLADNVLLYLSNPIDDQGFCTTAEKMALFSAFCRAAAPVLAKTGWSLVVKLHGREDQPVFERALDDTPLRGRAHVLKDAPLYTLLSLSQAAIVLASTAGLEALVFGLRLGVLEIPHAGFAHDYVSRGAAVGIAVDGELEEPLARLLAAAGVESGAAERYLAASLATTEGATARVVEVIDGLVGGRFA